jgi:uroporphyrin-III C-methyltransferase
MSHQYQHTTTSPHQNIVVGKVVIAGAGPGDPELITMKAFRFLQNADVLIVDRLVSEDLLGFIKEGARVIFAGKQGGNENSVAQAEINDLLVEEARKNKLVLRLKGGDASIFSNLLDELAVLVAHKIPYQIIPGITAASGAAAAAGIPLTARGLSAAVRFLTCYKSDLLNAATWEELARTDDTLVFYMSSGTLSCIVGKLLDHGISNDKYLAIVEQATTPHQNVQIFNLHEYEMKPTAKLASPSLIIIGKVARLHAQFKWLPNASGEEYFPPLQQKKILSFHISRNKPYADRT